jgi:hypothetical protein
MNLRHSGKQPSNTRVASRFEKSLLSACSSPCCGTESSISAGSRLSPCRSLRIAATNSKPAPQGGGQCGRASSASAGSGIGNSTPLDTCCILVFNAKPLIVLISRHFRHLKLKVRRDLRFPLPSPFPASCTASNTHSSVSGCPNCQKHQNLFRTNALPFDTGPFSGVSRCPMPVFRPRRKPLRRRRGRL